MFIPDPDFFSITDPARKRKGIKAQGDFLDLFVCGLFNTTLFAAPRIPLCWTMLVSNPGLLRLWHCQSDALTIRLDLM
jgi:hypothetical protein